MTILHVSVLPNRISSQINFIYTIMTSLGHIRPWFPVKNKLKLQGNVYNLFLLPPFFIFFNQCDNDHLKSVESSCNQEERIWNTESVKFTIELNYIHPKSNFYPRREKNPKILSNTVSMFSFHSLHLYFATKKSKYCNYSLYFKNNTLWKIHWLQSTRFQHHWLHVENLITWSGHHCCHYSFIQILVVAYRKFRDY